jgi:hypothetical protein
MMEILVNRYMMSQHSSDVNCVLKVFKKNPFFTAVNICWDNFLDINCLVKIRTSKLDGIRLNFNLIQSVLIQNEVSNHQLACKFVCKGLKWSEVNSRGLTSLEPMDSWMRSLSFSSANFRMSLLAWFGPLTVKTMGWLGPHSEKIRPKSNWTGSTNSVGKMFWLFIKPRTASDTCRCPWLN